MSTKLALIHTSASLIPMFEAHCASILPGVETLHFVDESLIRNTIAAGRLEEATTQRVLSMVEAAREAGADAVLITCSSIGNAATYAESLNDFPVLRIDDALAEKAVSLGYRIGVLATLRTTLEPTIELVRRKAAGRDITIVESLCAGAFEAVMAGDTATHDAIVSAALLKLIAEVDVVVLAQASMARVLGAMDPASLTIPVLSSPELAVRRVADALKARV